MEMHYFLSISEILIDGAAVTIHKSSLIFKRVFGQEKGRKRERNEGRGLGWMVGVELNSLPNVINRHSPASLLRKLEMGILKSGAVYHHR